MNFFKTLSAAAIFGSVSAVGAWAQDDTDAANKDYDTLCEAGLAADANALEYLQCFHAVSLTTWHAIMDLEANHRLDRRAGWPADVGCVPQLQDPRQAGGDGLP